MPSEPHPRKRRADSCPLCGRIASGSHGPFCSQGCRDRDLIAWLGDGYRLAGPPAEEEDLQSAPDGLDSERRPPL